MIYDVLDYVGSSWFIKRNNSAKLLYMQCEVCTRWDEK